MFSQAIIYRFFLAGAFSFGAGFSAAGLPAGAFLPKMRLYVALHLEGASFGNFPILSMVVVFGISPAFFAPLTLK